MRDHRFAATWTTLTAAVLALLMGAAPATAAELRIVRETPLQLARGPAIEALEIECEITGLPPGVYTAEPVLVVPGFAPEVWGLHTAAYGASRATIASWWRPEVVDTWEETGQGVRADSLGRARFVVTFDGAALHGFAADGPWGLRCAVDPGHETEEGPTESVHVTLDARTRPWRRAEFAHRYGGELERDNPMANMFGSPARAAADLILAHGDELAIATVLVADTAGTNAHPPIVRMRVDERLQGTLTADELSARWSGGSLYLICATGEGETIRRWDETVLPPPAVGSRWICALQRQQDGTWTIEPRLRWPYADSLLAAWRTAIAEWPARLPEIRADRAAWQARMAKAAAERERRERPARRRAEAQARARAAAEKRAAATRVRDAERALRARAKHEAAWRRAEHTRTRRADLAALTNDADAVALVRLVQVSLRLPGQAPLAVEEWLVPPGLPKPPRHVAVMLGVRESSLVRRFSPPADPPPPGQRGWAPIPWFGRGDTTRCIAFLSESPAELASGRPGRWRLLDPASGLLLADAAAVSRLRRAVAARKPAATLRPSGCGAALAEIASLPPEALADVQLKLTDIGPLRPEAGATSLLVGCFPPGATPAAYEVPGCLFPRARYVRDRLSGTWTCRVGPAAMRAVLDSLVARESFWATRADAGDSLSVTMSWSARGGRRLFECTLDAGSFVNFVAILATALDAWSEAAGPLPPDAPERASITTFVRWTATWNPRTRVLWGITP